MQGKPHFKLNLDGSLTELPLRKQRRVKAANELRRLIGQRIAEERVRLGRTQVDLSELINTTRRSIASWEAGYTTPNAEDLVQLLGLGFDLAFVLTGWRSNARAT
jgi:ribosome-binding protein aMBF1 (putative translation factor)